MFDATTFIRKNFLEKAQITDVVGKKAAAIMNIMDACGTGIDSSSVAGMYAAGADGRICHLVRNGERIGYLSIENPQEINLLIQDQSVSYACLTYAPGGEESIYLYSISYDEAGNPIRYAVGTGTSAEKMHVVTYEGDSISFATEYLTARNGETPNELELFTVFGDERLAIAPDSTIEEFDLSDKEAVRKLIGPKQKTNS